MKIRQIELTSSRKKQPVFLHPCCGRAETFPGVALAKSSAHVFLEWMPAASTSPHSHIETLYSQSHQDFQSTLQMFSGESNLGPFAPKKRDPWNWTHITRGQESLLNEPQKLKILYAFTPEGAPGHFTSAINSFKHNKCKFRTHPDCFKKKMGIWKYIAVI